MPDNHELAYLRNRLVASDPSLDRLRSGVRAVLTAGLAAALFLLVPPLLGKPYESTLAGIVVPMMAGVAVQDPGRKQQQVTMALIPFVASVALVLGSLAANNVLLSRGLFLLTIFAAFQARRFGARGTALGMIGYLSYFYAILLNVPASQVAWDPLFVFIGCAIAYAVQFWLVPEHPGRMLLSQLRAYRARIAALLHDLVQWLDRGSKRRDDRIDRQLAALNQQSLGLESRLKDFARDDAEAASDLIRDRVLRCEIAAETLVDVCHSLQDADADARRPLGRLLQSLAGRVVGRRLDRAAWAAQLAGIHTLSDQLCWRLQQAAKALADAAPWQADLPEMRDNKGNAERAASQGDEDEHQHWWSDDITRRALQACAAALGAMVVGAALSPQHWYWAVIAAFVVFTQTGTVGQAASKAWLRVLATVAGVCLGLVVAELVHGNRLLELSLLFVLIAIGFYTFRGWQTVYVAVLTAMLAMLYELLGMYSPGVLLQRLEETAIGAVMAVAAAAVIRPVHTRDESGRQSASLLRSARDLLQRALDTPSPPREAVRDLDRSLQAVRQLLGSVTGSAYPGRKENRRRHLRRVSHIVFCVRHCYNLAACHELALAEPAPLHDAGVVLAANMDSVAKVLDADQDRPAPSVSIVPLPAETAPAASRGKEREEQQRLAADWLAQANELLAEIVGRAERRSGQQD